MTRWRPALLAAVLLGPPAAGCAKKSSALRATSARYDLGPAASGWSKVDPGSADRAWHHPGISGTIYADSNCGSRYEDRDLDALADHLTWGIALGDPLREEPMTLDEHAALVRVARGSIDGIAVQVGMMVTKQGECIFDVLYLAPPSTFDQGWPDFTAVVGGFQARGRSL
jgi:hypothetical protein